MKSFSNARTGLQSVLAVAALVVVAPSSGAPSTLRFDSVDENKQTRIVLDGASPIRVEGGLRDVTSTSIDNSFTFAAGSSSLAFSAAWLVAPVQNRTTGFNIDLFDGSNSLVASDMFLGTVGGTQATSQLVASGLTPGALYRMVVTGTALQSGRYAIDLVNGATPPPAVAPLPVVSPAVDAVVYDTHVGDKDYGLRVAPGDRIRIDGIFADEPEPSITNRFDFTISGDTLSAGIEWIVAAGDQRTTGVNVDLLDSDGMVVASDSFRGLIDGEAFSQLAVTGLNAGSYRLLFTGTAFLGGRYHIDLSTDATAPGFVPIVAVAVPEPSSMLLMQLGSVVLLRMRPRTVALSRRAIRDLPMPRHDS